LASTSPAALAIIAFTLALTAPQAKAAGEGVDELTRAALAAPADPLRGRAHYERHCARCHGAAAEGDDRRRIPVLAGQRFGYLVRQLAGFATAERESAAMHPVVAAKELRLPQTWSDVAAYLHGAAVPEHTRTGDGRQLGLGEATFRIECASCHHDDARGDDDGAVPSLRNQNYATLLSQMRRLSDIHRHEMAEPVAQLVHSLRSDEAQAVADYVSRMRDAAP
jgi:cytochrome c553